MKNLNKKNIYTEPFYDVQDSLKSLIRSDVDRIIRVFGSEEAAEVIYHYVLSPKGW